MPVTAGKTTGPPGLEARDRADAAAVAAATADRRVRELETLLDSGRYSLLSLDVFDTLVWRTVPTPLDVHFRAAKELRRRDAIHASSSPESFVLERKNAEQRARARAPGQEATLEEIYAEFPRGYLRGLGTADVAAIEFEVEQAIVRVHPGIRQLVLGARARGLQVALVSDTYFSSRQIRTLAGLAVDHVLVSCERRVSKFHGLHRFLLEQSGVAPERVLHVGDHRRADVEGPAALRIDSYWFRKFPERYPELIESEMPTSLTRRAPLVEAGDAGVTSLRSRTMFEATTEYQRWGAGVLGPVVAGFSDWVIERCRELEISSALCLMREGRVLKQTLDLLSDGLETHEFFVSRFVALRAAFFDGSEAELRQFLLRPSAQRHARLVEQLGLEPEDLPEADPQRLIAPRETAALIRRVAGDPALRRKVVTASARVRKGLLAHLAAKLPLRPRRAVAVVDLGYKGTIQGALQRIFEREGLGLTTHGLYLVTGGDVHETQATGVAVEGWLAANGQPAAMAHTFLRSPEIVEQSLMADCGTTVAHSESGEPVLDPIRIPDQQRSQIAEVQRGVLDYARAWSAHKAEHGIVDTAFLEPLYRAIAIRSVARPLPIELELFGDWQHDENFGSAAARTLTEAADLHEWERGHMSVHQLASIPHRRLYWPFGFAHLLGRGLGEAVASLFLREARPEAFDGASPPRPLVFYWDSGGGFDAKRSAVREYTPGHGGRVWHRIELELEDGTQRAFGVSLGVPGEILQLTGFRLHLRPASGEPRCETFDHRAIEMHGYERLHGNLYRVIEDPALLAIPTPSLTRFTGVVALDLFFTVLPEVSDA